MVAANHMSTKMPELIVFTKAFLLGLALAEIFQISYIGGSQLYLLVGPYNPLIKLIAVGLILVLIIWYVVSRGLIKNTKLLVRSKRIDLLVSILLGAARPFFLRRSLENCINQSQRLALYGHC